MDETSFLALAHPVIVAWQVNHSWHAAIKMQERNKLHSGGSSCNCCCFSCRWGCCSPISPFYPGPLFIKKPLHLSVSRAGWQKKKREKRGQQLSKFQSEARLFPTKGRLFVGVFCHACLGANEAAAIPSANRQLLPVARAASLRYKCWETAFLHFCTVRKTYRIRWSMVLQIATVFWKQLANIFLI